MKSLSASIVVLAGTIVFTAGAFIRHDQTAVFVMLVGGAISVLGLLGWAYSLKQREA